MSFSSILTEVTFFPQNLTFFSAKPCIVFFLESLRYLVRAALPALKMHNKPIKNTLPAVIAFTFSSI